jgi:protein-disulfide isomerase/uncharacterized membrane protein
MKRSLNSALLMVVSATAVAAAAYLLVLHGQIERGTATRSICDINASFNCSIVNSSRWSEVAGVPVTVPAMGLYLTLMVLVGTAWRTENDAKDGLVTMGAGTALLTSVVMAVISKVELGTWCLFCMYLYLCSLLVFGLTWVRGPGLTRALRAGFKALTRVPAGPAGVAAVMFVLSGSVLQGGYVAAIQTGQEPDRPAEQPPFDLEAYQRFFRTQPAHRMPLHPDEAVFGNPSARVTVIEYADFECPFCQQLHPVVKGIAARYQQQIRFVFRHYPLDQACNRLLSRQMHPNACAAARAADCAGQQDRYWDMQDLLFDGKSLTDRDLLRRAKQLRLDEAAFTDCLNHPDTAERLVQRVDEARTFGLRGTPSLFVNGRPVDPDPRMLEAAIDATLEDTAP